MFEVMYDMIKIYCRNSNNLCSVHMYIQYYYQVVNARFYKKIFNKN